MLILIAIAAVCLLLGIMFLANKGSLEKISAVMNKVIIKDAEIAGQHAKALGIFLILFAAVLVFIALKMGH